MIIVGLDLATRSGICYGRPDTTPVVQVVRAPVSGDDLGLFGAFYVRFFTGLLDQLCARLEPEEDILVNYEAPVLPRTGMTQIATTRKLQSMGVLVEAVCHMQAEARAIKIDVRECYVASIKKELTGKGQADKGLMVLAARRAGIALPDGDEAFDGADAFGAWLLAIRHQAPAHQSYWDRRLYGGFRT